MFQLQCHPNHVEYNSNTSSMQKRIDVLTQALFMCQVIQYLQKFCKQHGHLATALAALVRRQLVIKEVKSLQELQSGKFVINLSCRFTGTAVGWTDACWYLLMPSLGMSQPCAASRFFFGALDADDNSKQSLGHQGNKRGLSRTQFLASDKSMGHIFATTYWL